MAKKKQALKLKKLRSNLYYPPVSFFFNVDIKGLTEENSFQEVSGISYDIQTEDIQSGGELVPYKVPKNVSYPNLVLKRGLVVPKSKLLKWCQDSSLVSSSKPIQLKDIHVQLLDPSKGMDDPILAWLFKKAYPVKYQASGLGADKNELVVESIELSYREWVAE